MTPSTGETAAVQAFRWLLRRAPAEFRVRFEDESVSALNSLLADVRASNGRSAAAVVWMRAMLDALRTVRRERARSGRHRTWRASDLAVECRQIVRAWRRDPSYAAAAIGTLALGLALNAGLFAFADGYLFRPLPFDSADRLFTLSETEWFTGVAVDDVEGIESPAAALAGTAYWANGNVSSMGQMQIDGRWIDPFAYGVSPRFADVIGFRMALGRPFVAADYLSSDVIPCWLGARFWQERFGGSEAVLGRRFPTSRGQTLEVVGVLPSDVSQFDLSNMPPDLVVPAVPRPVLTPEQRKRSAAVPIVRLAPGDTVEAARARLQHIVDATIAAHAEIPGPRTIRLRPFRDSLVRGGQSAASLLFFLGLLILVLVTVNFTQLVLARALGRTREIELRFALGAGRARVARLLLVEALAVAAAGLALGIIGGSWLAAIIRARLPQMPTGAHNFTMVAMRFDERAVAFTAIAAVGVALIAATVPIWQMTRRRALGAARVVGASPGALSRRLASVFVAAEVAVSVVVVAGAVLVGTSVWTLLHQPIGFDPEGRFWVSRVGASPDAPPPTAADQMALLPVLRSVPGVAAAGVGGWPGNGGQLKLQNGQRVSTSAVTSGYLEAIGARLLAGRTFSAGESAAAAPVVVVDERAANQLWPGESALGQILHEDSGFSRSVIGVVAHVRRRLVQDTGAVAFVLATVTDRNLGIVVDAPHASVASLAKSATLDGGSGAATGVSIEPLSRDRLFQRDAGEPTFEEPIVFALGGLTLVLAMVGLYGLANYLVQQRWREFGVRLALGASRSAIWGVVVRMSVAPSMVGVVLGGGLALWLERWLRSVVTGLSPSSIPAIATASALLLTAAVLAAIRPALRAQRADPALVLRAD